VSCCATRTRTSSTYEHGGAAQHGGIQSRTVPGGPFDAAAVEPFLRPAGWGTVATSAVSVEQTHNRSGGAVTPLPVLQGLRALTAAHGMALHCDGARIWNAAVASGTSLADYGAQFDTLSVCLSKGLGAPVGSLVVTDARGPPRPGCCASAWAAACARPACSPRPVRTPWTTTSSGSPTTTAELRASPRRWAPDRWRPTSCRST
jgi:hypothetical protein